MKIIMIDNYDSFTYNLVHLFGVFTSDIHVFRNDKISIEKIAEMKPDKIVISPGPGRPSDSGISPKVITELGSKIPLLGVCLGHQTIGEVFGAKITYAPELMHGKTSDIFHSDNYVYTGISNGFKAGRYHSLVIDPETLPDELMVTCKTAEGTIMGVRHKNMPIEGIQFHPESVLTPDGEKIIKNWLDL
ncbi:MAG: glutamine amidotransferase [Melioribacteraceae bacterium]|nr:MAG: glutamine amidotransferase [Melioribacteraceae bacterium]